MTGLAAALDRAVGTDPDLRLSATASALRAAAAEVPVLVGQMLREEADWYGSLIGDPVGVARFGLTGWSHGLPPRCAAYDGPVAEAVLLLDAGRAWAAARLDDSVGTVRRWDATGVLLRFDRHVVALPAHDPHPCRVAAGRLDDVGPWVPVAVRVEADVVAGELRNAASTLLAVPHHAVRGAAQARDRTAVSGSGQVCLRGGALVAGGRARRWGRLGRRPDRWRVAALSALMEVPVGLLSHGTAARIGRLAWLLSGLG